LHHLVQTAEWCLLLGARSQDCCSRCYRQTSDIRQVQIVTNVRNLFTHVALVLFITDVISDNECRKERETVF